MSPLQLLLLLIAVLLRESNEVRFLPVNSCLFDTEFHWWLINELNVLVPLCLPLVGNVPFSDKDKEGMDPSLWLAAENPSKTMEPELDIMKMFVECLVLLCQKRVSRSELRKRKVYPVLRNLDLKVEDEGVSAALYDAVNFLIGDEDPNETD